MSCAPHVLQKHNGQALTSTGIVSCLVLPCVRVNFPLCTDLVWKFRDQSLVLQQLKNDAVPKAKACTRLRLAAKRGEQAVIPTTSKDGS